MELYRYKNESENKKNFLKAVFDYNKRGVVVSRSNLAEKTGLSLTTIIKFVSEFIKDGIIEEFEELESTGGRKPISLRINPDYAYVISIDIGTFSTKIGVVKMNGEVSQKEIIPVKDNSVPTVGPWRNYIRRLTKLFQVMEKTGCLALASASAAW